MAPSWVRSLQRSAEGLRVRPETELMDLEKFSSLRRSSAITKPVLPSTEVMQTLRDMATGQPGYGLSL